MTGLDNGRITSIRRKHVSRHPEAKPKVSICLLYCLSLPALDRPSLNGPTHSVLYRMRAPKCVTNLPHHCQSRLIVSRALRVKSIIQSRSMKTFSSLSPRSRLGVVPWKSKHCETAHSGVLLVRQPCQSCCFDCQRVFTTNFDTDCQEARFSSCITKSSKVAKSSKDLVCGSWPSWLAPFSDWDLVLVCALANHEEQISRVFSSKYCCICTGCRHEYRVVVSLHSCQSSTFLSNQLQMCSC